MRICGVIACLISTIAVLLLGGIALVNTARADNESVPYKAYVAADEIFVRSGPGKQYYATEKLVDGDEVEVYRHDPGGWYAIRPPRGNFSWVAVRDVQQEEDDLGTVKNDRTICYVGTRFGTTHDCIQVRLDKGERVEILGRERLSEAPNAGEYYKVAPPSGEFRWVTGKLLRRTLPADTPTARVKPNTDENEADMVARSWAARHGTSKPRQAISAYANELTAAEMELDQGAAVDSMRARREGFHTTGKKTPAGPALPGVDAAGAPISSAAGDNIRRLDALQQELASLDVQLSSIVTQESSLWQFSEVRAAAEGLLARSQTAVERGRVRLLLNRIARFEDIQARRQKLDARSPSLLPSTVPSAAMPGAVPPVAQMPSGPLVISPGVSSGATTTGPVAAAVPPNALAAQQMQQQLLPSAPNLAPQPSRFSLSTLGSQFSQLGSAVTAAPPATTAASSTGADESGKLMPVVSQRPGAPRYALVNTDRQVVSFVTPAPGVNLQPYVGQQVSITGERGYAAELKKPTITAAQVTPLDDLSRTARR